MSISGSSSRSGRSSASPSLSVPMKAASTSANERPRRNSGISGIGGEVDDAPARGELVGDRADPLAPGVQHLGRALERPEQVARVELADGEEVELEPGDHSEAAASTAERPEQVRLVVDVDGAPLPVRRHHVGRDDAVCREAVLPAEPAEAPAERVADDAHVRRAAGEAREAVLGRGRRDVVPLGAGLDACAAALRIDGDPSHAPRLQQDRVVERRERRGEMASRLRGHANPMLAREVHDRGDVVSSFGERDRDRPLVVDDVPAHARCVPVGVLGRRNGHPRPQRREVVRRQRGTHRPSFSVLARVVSGPARHAKKVPGSTPAFEGGTRGGACGARSGQVDPRHLGGTP